jgi:hypothetical protein
MMISRDSEMGPSQDGRGDGSKHRDFLDRPGATSAAADTGSQEPSRRAGGDDELNENFGPVRTDDGNLHIGEGGNGLGPYGADEGVETSNGSARAKARYEPPRCEGDIRIGGQSNHRCDGPGKGSASAEGEAAGESYEIDTP